MNDWFKFNGVKCTQYGIHVSEHPPVTLPPERVTFVEVPGRSGSLTVPEGEDVYSDMTLTAECFVLDTSRVDEIAAWLKGGGKVVFANRQGGFYYGRVVNQIPFETVMRGRPNRTFAVNFRVKPFFYLDGGVGTVELTTSAQTLTNPGCVYAEPVITVQGEGDVTLMVGTQIVELTGLADSITIDTPAMEAYKGTTSMNGNMAGEFPILKPGANAISWSGSVTKVTVQPNWRTL